jgi:type II secretory pathway component GspD/PulD (secretin)
VKNDRTELIILITPHVIRNRQEANSVTEEYEARIQGLKEMIERVQRPKVRVQPPDPTAVPQPEKPH